MSIQVDEGGLPKPPVYDVPQYPKQGFDCESVEQMVDIVMRTGLAPVSVAREYWVEDKDCPTWSRDRRTLFSTSLFNAQGEEIAVFTHIMRRGQFLAKPDGRGRIWGKSAIDAHQSKDISHIIHNTFANWSA